jgi:hypothetical protein
MFAVYILQTETIISINLLNCDMKSIAYFLLLTTIRFNLIGQAPNIEWQKTFGGSANEEAFSILNTLDSGILILGYTASANQDVTHHIGADDFWLLKISKQGNLEWNNCYGGSGEDQGTRLRRIYFNRDAMQDFQSCF